MSHIVAKSAYKSLEERLNRFPQGAAPTKTLYNITWYAFFAEGSAACYKSCCSTIKLSSATAHSACPLCNSKAFAGKAADGKQPDEIGLSGQASRKNDAVVRANL